MNPSRYLALPPFEAIDRTEARRKIRDALVHNVHRIERHVEELNKNNHVYVGIGGLVLMNWHMSTLNLTQLPSSHLLRAADKYLYTISAQSSFSRPRSGSKTSFLNTNVGPATLILLRHLSHVRLVVSSSTQPTPPGPFTQEVLQSCVNVMECGIRLCTSEQYQKSVDDGCEMLFGRAGLLYGMLLLQEELVTCPETSTEPIVASVRRLVSAGRIREVVNDILNRGREGALVYQRETYGEFPTPPLMWKWHEKRYLGGAHGIVGILQILISCPELTIQPHVYHIIRTAQWLLSLQDRESGNWPVKAPQRLSRHGTDRNELIHWCHGAPSMVILLATLLRRPIFRRHISSELHADMLTSLARGADLVYKYGFLRKGVGLCHGVAGSVYALLAAASILDKRSSLSQKGKERDPHVLHGISYFHKALHHAMLARDWRTLTTKGMMETPDNPYSLYEGLAGMCCAWGAVLNILVEDDASERDAKYDRYGYVSLGVPGYSDVLV